MSKATEAVKSQLKAWGPLYYITEYLPTVAGLIVAMIYNPSIWAWLIFVLLAVLIVGGLIAAFKHSGKTIIWGIILVICIAVNGWIMYTIVGTCFTFSACNDLWIGPKYHRLRDKYRQYKNQDEYERINKQ